MDRQNCRTNRKSKAIQTKSQRSIHIHAHKKRKRKKKYIYIYLKKEESNQIKSINDDKLNTKLR